MHDAFKRYCKQYLIAAKSIESFGKDLKKLGWEDDRETSSRKERRTLWRGRKLKLEYVVIEELQQHQLVLSS